MEVGIDERRLVILIREYSVIRIRHPRHNTLKHGFPHWIQFLDLVVVVVLATPDPRLCIRACLAEAGDVDEQTVPDIDPSRIDYVHSISTFPLPYPWIDVEEELAPGLPVERNVLVLCLVVHLAEVVQCCMRDLCIEVKVPW